MATPSSMLALGTPAPDFRLPDVRSGRLLSPADFPSGQPLLVMFICRHCPYVKHVQQELARLGRDYRDRAGIVAISANDAATHPQDGSDSLAEMAREQDFAFPLLYDESQAVARAYAAACTPDYFLFDAKRRLAYRGQLDGSRPGSGVPVTGQHLRGALDALLAGRPPPADQRPSLGCSIKWKPV
jgi:peroxiredoxin